MEEESSELIHRPSSHFPYPASSPDLDLPFPPNRRTPAFLIGSRPWMITVYLPSRVHICSF